MRRQDQQVRDAAIAIHEAQMANSLIFLLRGSGFVPTLRPVEMPENFVAFKLVTEGAPSGAGLFDMLANPMIMMMGAVGGMGGQDKEMQSVAVIMGALDLSWSNGTTVEYGERRYLVTYKAGLDPSDLVALDKKESLSDTVLKLTLVRIDSIKQVTPRPDYTRARLIETLSTRLPKQQAKPAKEPSSPPHR